MLRVSSASKGTEREGRLQRHEPSASPVVHAATEAPRPAAARLQRRERHRGRVLYLRDHGGHAAVPDPRSGPQLMLMWDHLTARSLVDLQRRAALASMQEELLRLHREGYSVEADRVLDALIERQRSWKVTQPEWGRA